MIERDAAIMDLVKRLADQPQTNESLCLLNKLASLIVESTPHYAGMGETRDQTVRRWLQWD